VTARRNRPPEAGCRNRRGCGAGLAIAAAALLLSACAAPGGGSAGGGRGAPVSGTVSGTDPVDPQQLMGMAPAGVTGMLGEPELRRREGPAEVWQYRSSRCAFNIYMEDDDSLGQRVVYFGARSRTAGASVHPPQCLGEIVAGL
jgi:hypothetical protein